MSTSDAGELELGGGVGGGGGETATAGAARRTTAREYQDELLGRFCHKNLNRDTKWGEQNPPGIKQEETHEALRSNSLRNFNPSEVQIQSSVGPRFTSCLLLTFSRPELLRLRRTPDLRSAQQFSLIEPQSVETSDCTFQVDGRTPDAGVESVKVCPSETGLRPAKKEDRVITDVNHKPGITTDLTKTHLSSNGYLKPHEHNDSHLSSCVSQPRSYTGSLTGRETEKETRHHINLDNLSHLEKLSDLSGNMLSSTMVSVLATPWSGRPRRTKRFDGAGSSDTQGDLQEVSNTASVHERGFLETPSQHGVRSALTGGLHIPRNVPSLNTRRNTTGWSTKSDPSSLDFESKRIMTQAISLDSSATSPSVTASWSPRLDPNEQRRSPQTGHQGRPSNLSSEPTTSSRLLSLRRVNSNTPNSDKTFVFPDANNSTMSCSPNDQNGKLLTTHLSRTSPNNNEQQRPRPILSPSSMSYRTPETEPVRSPASSNRRERTASDDSLTQQPQTMNVISASLTSPKQSFQDKRPLEKQQSNVGSENTNSFSDTFLSSPRHSPYDHSTLLKTRSLPRRTILTSTSWWKQVSQEGSSPLSHNDSNITKDKSQADSPCQTDNKRLISQILSNRDNNNTSESVSKGNMNLALKTHSPESERPVKQLYSFNVDNREPRKPHSMPDCLPTSKLSTAAAQPTLKHTNHPIKKDVGATSFTSNLKELPVTTFNTQTSHTPTDNSNKYNGSPPKTNSSPTSLHNMDSQTFTRAALSRDFSNALNSQAPISLTTSGLSTTPNTKSMFSSQSPTVSSNASTNAPSAPTLKFSKIANVTPLGFERSYVCLPKPFRSKTASSLVSQVDSVTKPKGSTVSTPLTTFSSTTARNPSILSPSAITSPTPITASSFLTPPATPVTTSPSPETTTTKIKSIFSNSLERQPKKQCVGVEGKKERRVTWGDSVDVKCSESFSVEKSDSSKAQTDCSSPPRLHQSSPSIFSLPPGSPKGSTSPVCSPNLNTFSTHVGKGEKYRSFSSDSADLTTREHEKNKHMTGDTLNFDQTRQGLTTAMQERTLSVESGIVQCHSSTPLSLPHDFSSGLNLRYSAPPYSTLMSSRQALGEKKAMPQSFSISPSTQSNYTTQTPLKVDPHVAMSIKPPLSPIRPSQPSLAFQRSTATQDGSGFKLSDSDTVNNNHIKDHNQIHSSNQIQFLDNRVHISSQSLSGDKEHAFSSTYVTETLVYSIKPKVDAATAAQKNTTPKALQHSTNTLVSLETKSSQQLNTMQGKETGQRLYPDESPNNGKSGESYPCSNDGNNSSMKENVLSKSRFYSAEADNEQSPKKSRFALKRSASTPNSSVPRPERVSKSYNKVDQMFNKLKQKFSTRRSDDDLSFPWKWKRSAQAPSVSGSSDMSSVSDNSVDSTKTLEERVQENEMVLNHNAANTDETKRLTENRYTIIPALAVGEAEMENEFSVWSEQSPPGVTTDDQSTRVEQASKVHLTVHSPADQFNLYKNETQHKAANQFIPGPDPCADGSSSPTSYLTQCRKSTPSPRSPFSPFSSLSPLSPFPSPDGADDSVFYSPKLQRRRELSAPCEPREGISLGGSRRSRASTGPPSISPVQDKDFASSYADLKYGIEPGRSFSVSSVLSSRSSRPERISTGSRFMSVGDLSRSALSSVDNGKELYECSLTPDWRGEVSYRPTKDCQMSDFFGDTSKMRSRSLPRSWTRLMTNWSSGGPPSPAVTATSKPAFPHSPTMNTCHFAWDTDGPPTPPLTPPLSPVSRRMSKPPSLPSSPTFSSSPGAGQQVDIQPSRGHLPSRSYVSSLSTFDESSDSGSDTTTDDEYYLETDDCGGKETEL